MRKIGLDYGDSRIGIAFSDPMNVIASAYEVYRTRGWTKDIAYLTDLIRVKGADTVVLGMPLNMDGTEGERCRIVREFGARLGDATGLPVKYVDERRTTVEMEEFLRSQGVSYKKRKEAIDKLSAQLILKDYMEGSEYTAPEGEHHGN